MHISMFAAAWKAAGQDSRGRLSSGLSTRHEMKTQSPKASSKAARAAATRSNIRNRLIVAASEQDADMLYATKFWAPDPFIFLEQNGKRTLVLSDLEIDRGRKQAQADEFVPYSKFERDLQGKGKKTPPFQKVLSHCLRARGVRSALVPANFPLAFAQELAAHKIRLQTTNGLFWPEREAKNDDELRLMRRALWI